MTAVRALADRYLLESCALDPIRATSLGVPGYERLLTDYSPDGVAARAALARDALTELAGVAPDDDADRRCASLLRDRLGTELDLVEAGEPLRSLRIIGSPVGSLRAVFDLMAHDTPEQWADVAGRIGAVPAAYAQFEASLREGARRGLFAAPRQAEACAEQAATWAGQRDRGPWFETLAATAPDGVRPAAEAAARRATAALAQLAAFLRDEYGPAAAGTPDAVGRERYAQLARVHLGSTIDLDEAYAWGWDELHRIEDEMVAVAERIVPGGGIEAAMAHLDAHGEAIEGEPALKAWLQELMDTTIAELDGTHFAIAGPVRSVEAMIAPPGTAAAQYYTAPTADFSRPGRTWYPTLGRTRFPTWPEISTCYHEGVPGHHLHLAQWRYVAPELSQFQTSMGVTGTIEGWALYAERLMDELGYLDRPDTRLGYLDAQRLRAVRVVIDIGMHCAMAIPAAEPFHGGERWTPELGREFLLLHGGRDREFLESEWTRYLGWPGQAISYKLGERVWLAGREAARQAAGERFDLVTWHMDALSAGSLGLDDLAAELPTLGLARA